MFSTEMLTNSKVSVYVFLCVRVSLIKTVVPVLKGQAGIDANAIIRPAYKSESSLIPLLIL